MSSPNLRDVRIQGGRAKGAQSIEFAAYAAVVGSIVPGCVEIRLPLRLELLKYWFGSSPKVTAGPRGSDDFNIIGRHSI